MVGLEPALEDGWGRDRSRREEGTSGRLGKGTKGSSLLLYMGLKTAELMTCLLPDTAF